MSPEPIINWKSWPFVERPYFALLSYSFGSVVISNHRVFMGSTSVLCDWHVTCAIEPDTLLHPYRLQTL